MPRSAVESLMTGRVGRVLGGMGIMVGIGVGGVAAPGGVASTGAGGVPAFMFTSENLHAWIYKPFSFLQRHKFGLAISCALIVSLQTEIGP